MLNKFLKMNQPACIVLWAAIIYNLLFPLPGLFYTLLLYAGPILLLGHLGEWLALRNKLKALGHDGLGTFAKVMVYGFFWWIPVISETSDPSAP